MAFMRDPSRKFWGYDLMRETHLASGTIYPLLGRWLTQGLVQDGWAPSGEASDGPRRRYYELTDLGRVELGAALRRAEAEMSRGRLTSPVANALAGRHPLAGG